MKINHAAMVSIEAVAGGRRGIDFGAKNFSIAFLFGNVTLVVY